MAQKHHPDKEGGDATKFKEVGAAFDLLSDPERRAAYDSGLPDSQHSIEASARDGLLNSFNSFLETGQPGDPLLSMAALYTQRLGQIPRELKAQEKSRKKAQRYADALSTKAGCPNLLKGVADEHVRRADAKIAALKRETRVLETMREMLANFEFQMPAESDPQTELLRALQLYGVGYGR